jgi:CelD/BcsL family acetyltransferase involved in cellulose biosynthesis
VPARSILLEHGFADFLQALKQGGSHSFHKWVASKRRACRDLGPLRFEYHVSDRRELEALLHCKSAQYKRTGATDIFERGWTRDLLARIHAWQTEVFAGVLSVLYAGDQAIAWHLGMRSRSVLHYWFPAYRLEFSSYSPGFILLFDLIERAAERGLRKLDLGAGEEPYKVRLATSSIAVARGVIA